MIALLVLSLVMIPVTLVTRWRMNVTDRRLAQELDMRINSL
ncbi:hypothetical protein SEA_A3WALLY_339 [Microbacterium phage A3Wally]|nr:hypothetical protein SEA_A3WALLY_339 [Microbacterium phage A3Wally]